MKMKKYLKKKNQLKDSQFLVWLKIYNHFKNMGEENKSQEFRLRISMKETILLKK